MHERVRSQITVCFLLALTACSGSGDTTVKGAAGSAGLSTGAAGAAGVSSGAAAGGNSFAGQAGQSLAGRGGAGPGNAGRAATNAGSGGRGSAGSSSSAAGSSAAGGMGASGASGGAGAASAGTHFSFFITSLEAMRRLSGSQDGFGGDLRHGEADGLSGADKICSETAEASLPGSGSKGWHAFLSVASGPGGAPVHAIERIGAGPWYDRLGRVVAMNKAALANARPQGADSAIANDLPNEFGVPNHRPDPTQPEVDNHHVLTGSDAMGHLYNGNARGTCADWTSTAKSAGRPRVGFSWIADNRTHWISGQDEGGCGAGVALEENGGSDPNNPIVGSGGGYGAIYCFALMP